MRFTSCLAEEVYDYLCTTYYTVLFPLFSESWNTPGENDYERRKRCEQEDDADDEEDDTSKKTQKEDSLNEGKKFATKNRHVIHTWIIVVIFWAIFSSFKIFSLSFYVY